MENEDEFNNWLRANLDYLGDRLDLELRGGEREHEVGEFAADIVSADEDGRTVVIESQLDASNHDHLGKLLTYMAGVDARIGIWIFAEPRSEHIAAVRYLNEMDPENRSFFLIRLETCKIGSSSPAVLFTPVVTPETQLPPPPPLTETQKRRLDFWTSLLNQSNEKSDLFANLTPNPNATGMATGFGKSGTSIGYVVIRDATWVEVQLNSSDRSINERRFKALQDDKEKIEQEFTQPMNLVWDVKPDRKRINIFSVCSVEGGLENREKWPDIQKDLVERMMEMHRVFRPRIRNLE